MAEASEEFDRAFIVEVPAESMGTLMPLVLKMSRADLHESARTAIDAHNRDPTPQVSPSLRQGLSLGCAAGRCGGIWAQRDTPSVQATLKMIVLSALYYQFVEDGPVQPGEEEAVAWARSKAALSAKLFEPGKLISEISRLPAHATAALLGTCYINSDVNVVLANTFRADATKQIRGFKISVELTARGVQGLLPTLARAKNLAEVAIACQPQWGAPTLAAAISCKAHRAHRHSNIM